MLSSNGYATFVVAFAMFTDAMIFTLVLPFLPDLFTKRLHVPENEVSLWSALTFEAFAVAALVSNVVAGYLTDASASKSRPFVLSVMIMITSTLLFFLGTEPESIVIARAIQGASTTFVWVSGTAFLVSQVGEGDLGEYVGWMTVGIAAGEVAGPLLGGPIYDNLGHWAAFAIVQALLVVDILLRLFVKSGKVESEGKAGSEEDPETGELLQGGRENSSGYDTTQSQATESDSINSVMRGLAWNWLGTVFAMVAIFTIRGALEVSIPLYVIRQYSWTPTKIGLVLLTLLLPAALNPMVGKYASRYGPRWWSVGSFAICGAAMISFGRLTGGSQQSQILFVIHAAVIGIAVAILTNVNQIALSVSAQRYGDATARAERNGEVLGSALRWLSPGKMLSGVTTSWSAGLLLGPGYSSSLGITEDEGWAFFCHGLGGLCLVAALGSIFLWRDW